MLVLVTLVAAGMIVAGLVMLFGVSEEYMKPDDGRPNTGSNPGRQDQNSEQTSSRNQHHLSIVVELTVPTQPASAEPHL